MGSTTSGMSASSAHAVSTPSSNVIISSAQSASFSGSMLSVIVNSPVSSAVASSFTSSMTASSSTSSATLNGLQIPAQTPTSTSLDIATLSSTPSVLLATSVLPPSPSAPIVNRILRPVRNPAVDRSSVQNFVPSNSLKFFYAELAGTTTNSIQASLAANGQGILLENIAAITSVSCAANDISITFADQESAALAENWPAGTILFTLFDGCNSDDERGVYVLSGAGDSQKRGLFGNLFRRQSSKIDIKQIVEKYKELLAQLASASASNTPTSTFQTPSATPTPIQSSNFAAPPPTSSKSPYPPRPIDCAGYSNGRTLISGVPYEIYCGKMAQYPTTKIDIIKVASFTECIVSCNTLPTCVGVEFQQFISSPAETLYSCSRWSQMALPKTSGKSWEGKYSVARKIVEGESTTSDSGWRVSSVVSKTTLATSAIGTSSVDTSSGFMSTSSMSLPARATGTT
jgi:hypothetical protein